MYYHNLEANSMWREINLVGELTMKSFVDKHNNMANRFRICTMWDTTIPKCRLTMILKCAFTIWDTNCKKVNFNLNNKQYHCSSHWLDHTTMGLVSLKKDGKHKKISVNCQKMTPKYPQDLNKKRSKIHLSFWKSSGMRHCPKTKPEYHLHNSTRVFS